MTGFYSDKSLDMYELLSETNPVIAKMLKQTCLNIVQPYETTYQTS